MQYENPVIPGTHPDPTVCRAGDDFYLAVSSFEYVPGVPLFHSEDLVTWERIGHAIGRESQIDLSDREASQGIFAPTLRHHDGTFYLVTTDVGGGGHFYVTADDPAGEWSDPTYVDAGGIDPDLFFDDDGTVYFHYTDGETLQDFRIRQAEIDLETGKLGETRKIWSGIDAGFAEAPHLYERDGTYYLLNAEGGTHTNHMVTVGRSEDPAGPFEPCPHNPVLSHRGEVAHPISATGHGDLVQAPDGSWWIVFLAIRQHGGHPGWHHLGRETFLAPVEWEDGWPVVNGGETVEPEMTVESLPGDPSFEPSEPARSLDEDFAGDELADGWYFRYDADPESYDLTDEGLALRGHTTSLDDPGATFVSRPQAHFDCRIEASISFDPEEGEEAGLALLTNEEHHYDLGVTKRDGRTVALVRARIGDAVDVLAEQPVENGAHSLHVDADAETYWFGYGDDELASAASRYLSTEVAGGFTGVYVGPYTTATESRDVSPAHVRSFSYWPAER